MKHCFTAAAMLLHSPLARSGGGGLAGTSKLGFGYGAVGAAADPLALIGRLRVASSP